MGTKATITILLGLLALTVGAGAYIYPTLPETIATHWDTAGNVNGTMSKFWGVFLLPIIMGGMFLMYLALPYLDPQKGIHAFRRYYNVFWIFLFIFFIAIFKFVLVSNVVGPTSIDIALVVGPAVATLYFVIGWVLPHTKRNWFMGIRTPWTLSSDRVWDKTQSLGGILFKLSALGPLAAVVWPGLDTTVTLTFMIAPVVLSALITIIYSYVEFTKEKAGGQ